MDNINLPEGGGGGGGDTYTNGTPVPVTIGGIASGSTFIASTMQQMWDSLLYPYQAPSFSAFAISGQVTPLEVGDSILANRTFTWATANSSNVALNSISILDVTGAATIASGLANDGSELTTYGAITKTSATSNVFRIQGTNTQAGTFTRDYTVAWQWRRFYGESVSATLDETAIEALRVSGLSAGFAGTYAFNAGGYKYLCYPSALGTASVFRDTSNNLPVPMEAPYLVSVTNTFGQTTDYRVHRTVNVLGGAITIAVS